MYMFLYPTPLIVQSYIKFTRPCIQHQERLELDAHFIIPNDSESISASV